MNEPKLSIAKQTLGYREKKLVEFEDRIREDPDMWNQTQLLREAYASMLKESRARIAPDREILIRTAGVIAAGRAAGGYGISPRLAVQEALSIIAAADAP